MNADYRMLADDPITNSSQDKLGRGSFAKTVASLIAFENDDNRCQVFGIYGKWGEGKTSTKSLILEEYEALCKVQEKSTRVVEFDPWVYTEEKQLPFLFFNEVASAFKKKTCNQVVENKTGKVKVLASLTQIGNILHLPGCKTLSELLEVYAKEVQRQKKTLSDTKDEICRLLRKQQQRCIVVIDNLDRIPADHVRQMIQVVASNGDFPYMTYLLLCDRNYVSRALSSCVDGTSQRDGNDYLEKIVSFGLDLPRIRPSKIHEYVITHLQALIAHLAGFPKSYNVSRDVPPLVLQCLHDVRDVKRWLSGFAFHYNYLVTLGSSQVNVDISDLMCLEALRVFEPDFYHAIYKNKTELFDVGYDRRLTALIRDESALPTQTREWIDNNLLSVAQNKTVALDALEVLGWKTSSDTKTFSKHETTNNDRLGFRICHEKCFDTYFTGFVDSRGFQKAELIAFENALDDTSSDAAIAVLRKMSKAGTLQDFLVTIENVVKLDHNQASANFIHAMAVIAEDKVDSWMVDVDANNILSNYPQSFSVQLFRCVLFFVQRKWSVREDQSDAVMKAFRSDEDCIVLPVHVLEHEQYLRERSNSRQRLLADAEYDELNKTVLERIEKRQKDGRLIDCPDEYTIRSYWYRTALGSNRFERIRELLVPTFHQYPGILHAIRFFISEEPTLSHDHAQPPRYVSTINLDLLSKFVDNPEDIVAVLQEQPKLPDKFDKILDCLEFAIEEKQSGRPYDSKAQITKVHNSDALT